ncbi:hypothetical protein [Granulicella sp. dw_53]|uniref:hypothetical protein n=1 Tax=Granulicella sp. dw_53 TaxID=2719792 RepID=UPI001BD378CC|nr:hypothetical protein [Granulicella sp. dw_53]
MKLSIMVLLAIATVTCFSSASYAQVTVKRAGIIFETGDDDKDQDSRLQISIADEQNAVFGTYNLLESAGIFNDHSTRTFTLQLSKHPLKKALKKGHLFLSYLPSGTDQWKFKCTIVIDWSDGTESKQTFENLQLKDKQKLDLVFDKLK